MSSRRSRTGPLAAIGAGALLVIVAIFAGLIATGRLTGTCGLLAANDCSRVLFVGNSYTYVNDLPNMFAELARSGGHRVETGMAAEGGLTLADHVASAATRDKLASAKWDIVVLQEQSQIPSIEQMRTAQMYPAARSLVRSVQALGARPMLFVTWTHRDGWPENGLRDYTAMQDQLDSGYAAIAQELFVAEAPVGYAWASLHQADPRLDLWQADGSHPTATGTYLAACVFYATVFRQSPAGLGYLAGLPASTAANLQQAAATTVLTNPTQWNLP